MKPQEPPLRQQVNKERSKEIWDMKKMGHQEANLHAEGEANIASIFSNNTDQEVHRVYF